MATQYPYRVGIGTREGQDELLSLWSAAQLSAGKVAWVMKLTHKGFYGLAETSQLHLMMPSQPTSRKSKLTSDPSWDDKSAITCASSVPFAERSPLARRIAGSKAFTALSNGSSRYHTAARRFLPRGSQPLPYPSPT